MERRAGRRLRPSRLRQVALPDDLRRELIDLTLKVYAHLFNRKKSDDAIRRALSAATAP
jgi:hypothetical protein